MLAIHLPGIVSGHFVNHLLVKCILSHEDILQMVHKHAWTSLKKCSRFFGHQSIGQATPKLGSSASPWVQHWKVPRTTQFWPRSPCISPMFQPQKLHFWRSTSTKSSRNIQGISKQKQSDSLSCLPTSPNYLTNPNKLFFWGGDPGDPSISPFLNHFSSCDVGSSSGPQDRCRRQRYRRPRPRCAAT